MALKWVQLTLHVGGAQFTRRKLRKWVDTTWPTLAVGPPGAGAVRLKVNDVVIAGHDALQHLREKVLARSDLRLEYNGPPLARPKPRASPARRDAPTVVRQKPPVYTLSVQLADVDALFEPIGGGSASSDTGVRQRLQALGYLYTPLNHPHLARDAELCWQYFCGRVHGLATDGSGDAAAKAKLLGEVRGNLLASKFPASGEVLSASVLPKAGTVAALRFPGGYCCTQGAGGLNLHQGDYTLEGGDKSDVPTKYRAVIGTLRHEPEDRIFEDNPVMGMLPLLAQVTITREGKAPEAAPDVPLVVELIEPAAPASTSFDAPAMPDKVMNYSVAGRYWAGTYPFNKTDQKTFKPEEWAEIHRLTVAAELAAPGGCKAKAEEWLDQWTSAPWPAVKDWWGDRSVQPRFMAGRAFSMKANRTKALAGETSKPSSCATSDWEALTRMVRAADALGLSDTTARDAKVTEWYTAWKDLTPDGWDQVSSWWGEVTRKPFRGKYMALPLSKLRNAREAIDFLLADKANAATMKALELPGGQKKFFDDLYAAMDTGPGDPQRFNAPHTRCGKAGGAIADVLEQPTADRAGLHAPRAGQSPDTGKLAHATAADPGKYPHGTAVETNAKGWAGVLFTPSRCGGDRYRLRVRIDPDWLKQQAPGAVHVADVATGTMVVWRNIRWGRYLQLPTPTAAYSAELDALLVAGGMYKTAPDAWDRNGYDKALISASVIPGVAGNEPTLNARPIEDVLAGGRPSSLGLMLQHRPVAVIPTPLATHLARGYCELLADCTGPETITQTMQADAKQAGITAFAKVNKWARADKNVDWDVLCIDDATSPFLFTLRSHEDYNARIKAKWAVLHTGSSPVPVNPTKPINADDGDQFYFGLQAFAEAAFESLSGGGVLPGLTAVQMPGCFTYDGAMMIAPTGATVTSGYGTGSRGFWMAQTSKVYERFIYPCISNFLHELGHVLTLRHQYAAGGYLDAAHQPVTEGGFFEPKDDETVCVMSYSGCYGDMCGQCLLALRGWKQDHAGVAPL